MKWSFRTFAVLASMSLSPVAVFAQGSGSITGEATGGLCARRSVAVKAQQIAGSLVRSAPIDGAGKFKISGLPAGLYNVFPDLDAYRETKRKQVDLPDGGNRPVTFELGIELYGRLSCNDEARSNQIVVAKLIDDSDARVEECTRTARTDEDGRYAIAGLAAGTYQVSAAQNGSAPVERAGVELGGSALQSHDIVSCPSPSGSDFGYSRWRSTGTIWAR